MRYTITYLSYIGNRIHRIRYHINWTSKAVASRYAAWGFSKAEKPKVLRLGKGD